MRNFGTYWRTALIRVEKFIDNEWCVYSWHENMVNAVINAEVANQNGKYDARVIENGLITLFIEGGKSNAER